jgi:hypothetical protein
MTVLSVPLWSLACGSDNGPYVGAPCRGDFECAPGTNCADFAGGACLPACRGDLDCGPGYSCKNTNRRGASGKVLVCVPQ